MRKEKVKNERERLIEIMAHMAKWDLVKEKKAEMQVQNQILMKRQLIAW